MIPTHRLFGRLGNRMFQLAYLWADHKRGRVPDIYVQDSKYFDEFRADLQKFYGGNIGSRPEVGIHVRHGDYLTDKAFVVLTKTDYYEKAMALFPGEKFLVVSDDPAWCQEKWGADPRVRVVTGQDELGDMNTLASCKSQIIANSSFSWWAAYLNPRQDKTVTYPRAWHTDGVCRVGCPPEWIRID